jgi:hypothetical protein
MLMGNKPERLTRKEEEEEEEEEKDESKSAPRLNYVV